MSREQREFGQGRWWISRWPLELSKVLAVEESGITAPCGFSWKSDLEEVFFLRDLGSARRDAKTRVWKKAASRRSKRSRFAFGEQALASQGGLRRRPQHEPATAEWCRYSLMLQPATPA